MKTANLKMNSSIFFILGLILMTSFSLNAQGPRWERLGTRMVNYDLDRDEIPVTLAEGTFNSVKLVVNRSPIHIHRFVIHFSNGGTQEVWVRNRIPKGDATRVIDLKGGNRGIKKVVFWYDTGKLARGRAIIELWARH